MPREGSQFGCGGNRAEHSSGRKNVWIWKLGGKICVVTGASKGIGLAITRALVAGACTSTPSMRVTPVAIDLGSREGPSQFVKRAVDDHGRIDVLVNNLGGVRLRRAHDDARRS